MVGMKFSGFTDWRQLKASFKRAKDNALSRAGAFVRRDAKGSIRSGKKPAQPGSPPHSHTGRLKDLIFFAVTDISVVIGPLLFRRRNPTAPQLLEEGGATQSAGRPQTYRKFPYMEPALEKNAPKFPALFTDSIK